jgi:sigma-B regulation protein RsbU (phosphoserine phosphatase)
MKKNQRCILLVDDEQNILNALRRELRGWALERSLEILAAISAREGLEVLAARGADTVIVVSDLRMPEMKGSDFLLEVQKRYPSIVSVLLTGFSETNEIVKAVQAGIYSFMLKPWESEYLIAELTKAYDYHELREQRANYLKTVEEELKWAGEMQKAILKPNLPRSDGVEFRVSYRPVPGLYCGGDYYDVIFLGADRYLLLIGDVAGHGVKAAFVTGILKAIIYPEYIRSVVGKNFSPGAFLGWLNDRMNYEFRSTSSMVTTFFAGVLDLGASLFRYANAGHNHPFIITAGKASELPVSGSAIGFANTISYAEQSVDLRPDDIIVLFTDGLVEADFLDATSSIKLGPILEKVEYGGEYHRRILESALSDSGTKDFADDVTIVTARLL